MHVSFVPILAQLGLPEQGSTVAPAYDQLWLFLLLMSAFFTILIMGLLIAFVIKHRQRSRSDRAAVSKGVTHSTPLELTWIVVPTVIVIALFVFGFKIFLDMNQAPANATEIIVKARQWDWNFVYPDGQTTSKLHVPADKPIKVQLQSQDVIHSFFVPAFRVKKDAVPGRYNKAWFEATWQSDARTQRLGEVEPTMAENEEVNDLAVAVHPLYCAEYCGRSHSQMLSEVVVHKTTEGFKKWKEAAGGPPAGMSPVEVGKRVWNNQCKTCHMVGGVGGNQGPPWDDLYGREEQLAGGGSVVVDDEYIRESILYPNREITAGYENAGAMPSFKGLLTEWQIDSLIAYMQSISDGYDGPIRQSFE